MRTEVGLYDNRLKQAILDLPYASTISDNGPHVFIPESDYGYAEIYRMYNNILIFVIPHYSGAPSLQLHGESHTVDYLIAKLREMNS